MGGSNEKLLYNEYWVLLWEDVKVLEMDGGGGCKTTWMYLMSQNCMLRMFKMENFMLCICYHKKYFLKGIIQHTSMIIIITICEIMNGIVGCTVDLSRHHRRHFVSHLAK